jgi:hypothetical protein
MTYRIPGTCVRPAIQGTGYSVPSMRTEGSRIVELRSLNQDQLYDRPDPNARSAAAPMARGTSSEGLGSSVLNALQARCRVESSVACWT